MAWQGVQFRQPDGSWAAATGEAWIQSPPGMEIGDAHSLFRGWSWIERIPMLDTSGITNMTSMFQGCSSLVEVPEFDTSSVTNMASMFNLCSSLAGIPGFDFSSVSNAANVFNGCSSLERVQAQGMSANFSVANTAMEAEALDELFENLAEVEQSRTVTISGTPGAADCDRSIAIEKGWSVAG